MYKFCIYKIYLLVPLNIYILYIFTYMPSCCISVFLIASYYIHNILLFGRS